MTKAVLLAGGRGERLRPLTFEMAKSMIPVQGRPLIDHAFDLFYKYRVYEIWLSVGHRQQEIRDKYPLPFLLDFHTDTGKIIPLGTGGWLNRIANSVDKKYWNEDFYACNVDNLFNLNLDNMMKQHRDDKNVVTIACTKVKDISQYGSVHIKDGKVFNFEEKKKSRVKKSGWINGGYYIISPRVFKYVKDLKIDFNDPMSLENDLFPILAKEGVLGGFKVEEGQWFDTGTFERWEKVLKEWRGIQDNA